MTGYSLSGTIAEGNNTITVTYSGMTSTFTVTGTAEEVVTYTVSTELVNVTISNAATTIRRNASYTATLTATEGYELNSVSVTMGGVDVTATAYSSGAISIAGVTGNIEIVAIASVVVGEAELLANGLLAYFDLRTATYNNKVTGGATTISPTQGSGKILAWANDCIAGQNEYGIQCANDRGYEYITTGTSKTDIGSPMTLIVLTYGHVMKQGFTFSNMETRWSFRPEYLNTNGSSQYVPADNGVNYNADSEKDYNFCVYRVNGDVLTEIMDSSTATYDGDDVSDFAAWITTASVGVQLSGAELRYITAAAIYNRALTDIEIEEMRAFMKTLEVNA